MITVTKEQIDAAIKKAKAHPHFIPDLPPTNTQSFDYHIKFDRDYGFVTMFVMFSNGLTVGIPVNYANR